MHTAKTHVPWTMDQLRAEETLLDTSGDLFFDNGSKETLHVTCETFPRGHYGKAVSKDNGDSWIADRSIEWFKNRNEGLNCNTNPAISSLERRSNPTRPRPSLKKKTKEFFDSPFDFFPLSRYKESERKKLSRRDSKGAAVEITNRSSMEQSKPEIKGEDPEKGKPPRCGSVPPPKSPRAAEKRARAVAGQLRWSRLAEDKVVALLSSPWCMLSSRDKMNKRFERKGPERRIVDPLHKVVLECPSSVSRSKRAAGWPYQRQKQETEGNWSTLSTHLTPSLSRGG
ncbi:hypothetical protein WN48_10679 [Eufriesea mexicana]|uniref:Uncharacterized protein n=1 Tax=Eufriesea mexicana TaxID=516756 RepID=A0A310SSG4_9HYME|nr:hypothetical protein WN48_10679 [Eufriesea mexicana]